MQTETTANALCIRVDIPAPPERVWTLLTEPAHIAVWWGDHVELAARRGGALRETWSEGARRVVTAGTVTRCDPPRELAMTWADEGWPGATEVIFRLSGRDGSTRLVLEHGGWDVHSAPERQALIDAHAQGWSRHLSRLAEYAVHGR
jgi:uncharacterized protein YndB with AHSA1/START domain